MNAHIAHPQLRMRPELERRARDALRDRGLIVNLVFLLATAALVVVAAFTSPSFLTQDNMTNLLSQMVTNGLLSVGMLIVILTAGIDLTVGSLVAFTGIVCAGLVANVPLPVAIVLATLLGTGCGAVNGALIARFGLAPFVVTLAGLTTYRGFAFVYSQIPIAPASSSFLWLGSTQVGPIPVASILMLAVFVLAWVFVTRTTTGRALVAIGGNPEAARLAGINVRRHLVLAYAISGFTAGLAGVILASRVGIAQPSVAVGYELTAIAACVIGGASFMGGRGSIVGTLGGVVLLGLINNLQNLYNVQSYWQQVLAGLIIVTVVLARRAGASEGGG